MRLQRGIIRFRKRNALLVIALLVMWIRKSSEELTSERRARCVIAGLCATTVVLLAGIFGIPHAGFHIPGWIRMPGVLAAGVLLLAWRRRAHWRRVRLGLKVCEECNIATVNQLQQKCVCGGTLTPLPQMKWLEASPSAASRPLIQFPCMRTGKGSHSFKLTLRDSPPLR